MVEILVAEILLVTILVAEILLVEIVVAEILLVGVAHEVFNASISFTLILMIIYQVIICKNIFRFYLFISCVWKYRALIAY